ncbi:MAG TPA: hypothetical protein ENJ15_04360 [Caldithrix abyssi]|uniref:Uncharacterized protein n=1 Tax=Caldithrix abyssi TaxID=187145 RepID=A0A7V5RPS3_CALAY|nr:hypothetical protein [Caldithrix abyssi]
MCANIELKKSIDSQRKKINAISKDVDSIRATVDLIATQVKELVQDKTHDVFRRKRDEDALITIMLEVKEQNKKIIMDMANLQERVTILENE